MVMAFLDMGKVYDSVERSKVWEALEKRGVRRQTAWRIREIYQGIVSCVKVGG